MFCFFLCKKQHGVFTESSQALNTQYNLYSKLLWQAYVRHNHSPKQIFSAIFFYFEVFYLHTNWLLSFFSAFILVGL